MVQLNLRSSVIAPGLQARNMSLPTGTLYVAEAGFLLERAQVWMPIIVQPTIEHAPAFYPAGIQAPHSMVYRRLSVVAIVCFAGAKACAADGA